MSKKTGYVIHENDKIVVIATGFARKSKNPKTGNMIQTWILYRNRDPLMAVKTGADMHICMDCPLRSPNRGPDYLKDRACYVQLKNAPLQVWRAWRRGNYPILTDYSLFDGKSVRFGSYGEPVLIPFNVVKEIVSRAKNWTGYTHQWKSPVFQAYKSYFMASTSEMDYQMAESMGWRTFTVSDKEFDKHTHCPASEEMGKRSTCEKCGLCKGNAIKARSVVIRRHGIGKNASAFEKLAA